MLDASFSFDGVIGAFALSNNLFIIAIGLGIGAMFVRSLTIMLVERETLASYRYLEHGAFYAIVALALMMFFNAIQHIPEFVTGLIGAGFIITAFVDSIRYNRRMQALKLIADDPANPVEILTTSTPVEPTRRQFPRPTESGGPQ
jgi:hypothetical protein